MKVKRVNFRKGSTGSDVAGGVGTRGAVETLSRNKHTAMSFRPLLAGPSRVCLLRESVSTAPRVPTGALALGYALSAVI
jgi:hypothetical protein